MRCVILAAGRGSRLAAGAGPKPLLPVLGLPLLERTIVTASEAGLSEFFVVTGCQAARVESFLSALRLRRNLEISAIRNEAWEAGNASSLLAARHVLDEDFVLLVADHVFDAAILRRLLGQQLDEGEIVLAVDFRVDDNALVDVEDATKVAVRGQWVAAVGKELTEYDAFDTGFFLCSPAILPAFEVSIREGETTRSPAGCGGWRSSAGRGCSTSAATPGSTSTPPGTFGRPGRCCPGAWRSPTMVSSRGRSTAGCRGGC
jgi:choline kinase